MEFGGPICQLTVGISMGAIDGRFVLCSYETDFVQRVQKRKLKKSIYLIFHYTD